MQLVDKSMRHSRTMFCDRAEAADLLAEKLKKYKGKNPLVLAISRGAVPIGKMIADQRGGELGVVLVRKLRAPLSAPRVASTSWPMMAWQPGPP